jgi:glycosyltransferase involved in cell wall biosynthesis
VQEFIVDGTHGRLAPFDDVEALTGRAVEMLAQPEKGRQLGQAARQRVLERYELGACLKRLVAFFEEFDPGSGAIDQVFTG